VESKFLFGCVEACPELGDRDIMVPKEETGIKEL
jgi:hypothetical protein